MRLEFINHMKLQFINMGLEFIYNTRLEFINGMRLSICIQPNLTSYLVHSDLLNENDIQMRVLNF